MSAENISPTRINLIQTKKTLKLAQSGREVLERKRDILLRELRTSVFDAEKSREDLLVELAAAYQSLKEANMAKGSEAIANTALTTNHRAEYLIDYRSIMGVPVPVVNFHATPNLKPDYGFANTSAELDKAFKQFYRVVELLAHLAKAEGTTFQIANDVKRTQRRVNALNYVLIPRYRNTAKWIELVLEEKDREEFVRTKKIKGMIKKKETEELKEIEAIEEV
ncbi:MAG TPA: V-type ATP synthase subunit D [Candidatus Acidoferrales bacterium]|nr:V-type ATP synthase subunit D [Candidatus Acidoferrales bacterium]